MGHARVLEDSRILIKWARSGKLVGKIACEKTKIIRYPTKREKAGNWVNPSLQSLIRIEA